MAYTTGKTYPSTFAQDSGSISWSNLSNVGASDNTYATASVVFSTTVKYVKVSNFGFAIPSTAIITKVTAYLERKVDSATPLFRTNTLIIGWSGGVLSSPTEEVNFPTVEATWDQNPGSSDTAWTTLGYIPSVVNDSSFYVEFTFGYTPTGSGSTTAYIDSIAVDIEYELPIQATDSIDTAESISISTTTVETDYVSNNVSFVFNMDRIDNEGQPAITFMESTPIACMVFDDATETMKAGKVNEGQLINWWTGTDRAGTAITWFWRRGGLSFGDDTGGKTDLRYHYMIGRFNENPTITVTPDDTDASAMSFTAAPENTDGTFSEDVRTALDKGLRARFYDFKVAGTSDFRALKEEIAFKQRRRR